MFGFGCVFRSECRSSIVVCISLVSLGVQKGCTGWKARKCFIFFRPLKAGYALSPKGGEHIYPPYRCPACPCGPAAERVCGSCGNQGACTGYFYLSIYLYLFIYLYLSIYLCLFLLAIQSSSAVTIIAAITLEAAEAFAVTGATT